VVDFTLSVWYKAAPLSFCVQTIAEAIEPVKQFYSNF